MQSSRGWHFIEADIPEEGKAFWFEVWVEAETFLKRWVEWQEWESEHRG